MDEETVHQQIADYLRLQYPRALFHSDFGSGVRLTPGQARKQYRVQGGRRAWPDIFIAEPKINRTYASAYTGLFLEVKSDKAKIYMQSGALYNNPHLQEQAAVLQSLRERGYKAEFVQGFEQAKRVIDEYFQKD